MPEYEQAIPRKHAPPQCEGCYFAEAMEGNVAALDAIMSDPDLREAVGERATQRARDICTQLGALAVVCEGCDACYVERLPEETRDLYLHI